MTRVGSRSSSHAALFDLFGDVLEDAVLLAAAAELAVKVADRHAFLVKLVQVPAGIALHAQAPQPVTAHGLPDVAAAAALGMVRADRGGGGVVGVGVRENGGGAGSGGVEGVLEIEDEVAVVAVHSVG